MASLLNFPVKTVVFLVSITFAQGQSDSRLAYDIGTPVLTSIWVDPALGNDGWTGATREQAVRTLSEAWNRIPQGQTLDTGYHIMLTAGVYGEGSIPAYWESRRGSSQHPVIVEAADGPGSSVLAAVSVYDCSYLYFIAVGMTAGGGDVLHLEKSDHILLRQLNLRGTGDIAQYEAPDETLKVNQSQYVYVEDSDVSGANANAIDFVAVQYGHIVRNRIHHGGDWCMYLKGGSAYYQIEGNEIFDCGTGGFTAGQGSGLEFMVSPWIHYEASDINFVNNVIHDTQGAGFGANGAYNVLFAYNTLYRVGQWDHAIEVVYGYRSCDGNIVRCAALLAEGGWGVAATGDSEPIPSRNIYVYNNLVYNTPDFTSAWQQFAIYGPVSSLPGSNLDNTVADDTNLQIRGNVIWNGAPDLPLGIEDPSQGCQPANPACNAVQLAAENLVNVWRPSFADAAAGDFHLLADSAAAGVTLAIPAFPGDDRPNQPPSPSWQATNVVLFDREGNRRTAADLPGAYALPK